MAPFFMPMHVGSLHRKRSHGHTPFRRGAGPPPHRLPPEPSLDPAALLGKAVERFRVDGHVVGEDQGRPASFPRRLFRAPYHPEPLQIRPARRELVRMEDAGGHPGNPVGGDFDVHAYPSRADVHGGGDAAVGEARVGGGQGRGGRVEEVGGAFRSVAYGVGGGRETEGGQGGVDGGPFVRPTASEGKPLSTMDFRSRGHAVDTELSSRHVYAAFRLHFRESTLLYR